MNLILKNKKLLEEATTKGTLTLDGEVRKLSNSEVISCIKYVLSNTVVSTDDTEIFVDVNGFGLDFEMDYKNEG